MIGIDEDRFFEALDDIRRGIAKLQALENQIVELLQSADNLSDAMDLMVSDGHAYLIPDKLSGADVQHKPNVQIYEEVIEDHGRPMHLVNIVDAAQNRGLRLRGTQDAPTQVRNALAGSKRFVNTGANVWWIEGRPLPPKYDAAMNGHKGQQQLRTDNDPYGDDIDDLPF